MRIRIAAAAAVMAASAAAWLSAHSQQGAVRPDEPIQPLPAVVTDQDPGRVRLGEKLFSDKRLSGNGTISCLSCHLPEAGGADPRRHSLSANGATVPVNAPTIYNLRYMTRGYNWLGFTPSLERQMETAVTNPGGMAGTWAGALARLQADRGTVEEFRKVFGGDDPVTQRNVIDAIVAWERAAVTRSRFDDWLAGDDNAISPTEKLGYEKFKYHGCTSCHNGINVGGNLFATIGFVGNYFTDRVARGKGELTEFDKGRMLGTRKPQDVHVFRVPSLRNVELTAPYFHDGAVETLDEAILLMGRHQLGVDLPAEDRRAIAAFLGSLTGKELAKAAAAKAASR